MALAMQALSGTTHFADAIARRSGGVWAGLPVSVDACDTEELLTKFTQIVDQLGVLARASDGRWHGGRAQESELKQRARNVPALLQPTFIIYQAPDFQEG